jgi:DNA-binding response OmpR family regulator
MNLRLLYIEDEPDDVFLFRRAVETARLNVTVYAAETSESAIQWFNGTGKFGDRDVFPLPDILVIDLKMPIGSGIEVLKAARNNTFMKTVPVLVYSNATLHEDVETARALGVTSFIAKSADPTDLIAVLRKNIRNAEENRARSKEPRSAIAA